MILFRFLKMPTARMPAAAYYLITVIVCSLTMSATAPAQVRVLMAPQRVVLNDSLFQSGKSEINQSKRTLLDSIGVILQQNPDLAISVDGFADNSGTQEANMRISAQRAAYVQQYIQSKFNVDPSRVVATGRGTANPIGDNATPEGRLRNRRVEISVLTPLSKRPVVNSDNSLINAEGHISYLQRDVESKPPWAPLFADAYLNQPIFELQKIHTKNDSRSVVTFNDRTELKIGENTILIIYGSPAPANPQLKKQNIELTQGGLLAKLRSLNPANNLTVKTPAASIQMKDQSNVDIAVGDQARSAVSVFEGASKVSAREVDVAVPAGFGTTVDKGKIPAPPRKLPLAPVRAWADGGTLYRKNGIVQFRWKSLTSLVRIDISRDSSFSGLEKTILSADSSASIPLDNGLYFVQLSGFDSAGLKSIPDVSQLNVADQVAHAAKLVIGSPASAETTVATQTFEVSGVVSPGSEVTINNMAATVNAYGNFTRTVSLSEGNNDVSLNVKDQTGGIAAAHRRVVREIPPGEIGIVGFGVSAIDRFAVYDNIDQITLFHLFVTSRISASRSIGVIATLGQISPDTSNSLSSSAVVPGNRGLWMLRGTVTNDLLSSDQVTLSMNADAGPMGWFGGATSPTPFSERLALTAGGGITLEIGHEPQFGIGLHYLAIFNDGGRFQASSGNNTHSLLSLDFSISVPR